MAERTDTERFGWLVDQLHGNRWADHLDWMRPIGDDGWPTEKYIDRRTFRSVVDAEMDREPPADPNRPAAILAREFPLPEAP